MPTKIAAPRTEKGYVNSAAGWGPGWGFIGDQFELNPDLMWPNSVATYTRMLREDARVSSVLRALGLPIRRTTWRIRQNGASDEVTAFIAQNLGLPIEAADEDEPTPRTRDRFSWDRHLALALTYQAMGHSVFEQVYRIEGSGKNTRAHLHKLAPRPQSTIAYWNVARDGGLISIQQWPAGTFSSPGMFVQSPTNMGKAIKVDDLVIYVRDPDPGVWTGNSLLRPAYKHWKLKDELMRIEAAAARRHGIGVPGFTSSEPESEDAERLVTYQEMASDYRGGENAGFSIPYGATFKLYSPEGTPMDPRRAIEYHDHQIALVALAHFLNLDGKGGSYALASVQADTFVQSVQTVADDIREITQAHVVEDLVDLNFGADAPAPLLVCDEIGSRQDATAAALQMLVNSGLITPDPRLEQFVRTTAGLPGPDAPPPEPGGVDAPENPSTPPTRAAAARSRQRREHPKNRQDPLF